MGIKAFMSQREKSDLIDFIAVTGENYDRYLEWCKQRGIEKVFTKKYLHTWVQRHRPRVKVARIRVEEEIRRMSMFDKEKRIRELENDIDMVNQLVQKSYDIPEMMVKLLEQKRKLLQAVAQERGEWLRVENKESDGTTSRNAIRARVMEVLEGQATEIVPRQNIVAKDQGLLQ